MDAGRTGAESLSTESRASVANRGKKSCRLNRSNGKVIVSCDCENYPGSCKCMQVKILGKDLQAMLVTNYKEGRT